MRVPAALVWLGLLSACNRTEEQQSDVAAPSTANEPTSARAPAQLQKDAGSNSAQEPTSPTRCMVQTPIEPPPEARPAANCPTDPGGAGVLPRGYVTFLDAPARPRIMVELALDDAARERGLMYRTELAADAGMLFSWSSDAPRSFWMKNTCLSLDMLFIANDGFIAGILENVPTLNEAPRGIACPVRHVLEVNAGYCRAHGIKAGQKVSIDR